MIWKGLAIAAATAAMAVGLKRALSVARTNSGSDNPAARGNDQNLMRRAYQIAVSAIQNGNHPFGALIVHRGKVLLEAENTVVTSKDITEHAETSLVRLASARLSPQTLAESTLYTSTEPCLMCIGAIHWSRIGRIVYGVSARRMVESLGGTYRAIPCREAFQRINPKVTVIGPLLEDEGLKIHEAFWCPAGGKSVRPSGGKSEIRSSKP